MGFDFGTPESPKHPSTSTPAKGVAKAAPSGFDFGPQHKPSAVAAATGVSAASINMRCPNCGAQMARTLVPPDRPTHAPKLPEFGCPKCGYNTPY